MEYDFPYLEFAVFFVLVVAVFHLYLDFRQLKVQAEQFPAPM